MTKGKEYFDSMAASWDEKFKPDYAKINYILSFLGDLNGGRVLDVGTGTGALVPLLKPAGCRIDAIDISEKMIEVARAKYSDVADFIVDDIQTAQLQNRYDVIVCHNVYPHFADKEVTLKNIKNHLLDKGKLLIAHSCSREEINRRHRENESVREDVLPSVAEVTKLAEKAGFKTLYTKDAVVYVYLGVNENQS